MRAVVAASLRAANGISHNPSASGTIPGYFSAGVRPAAFLSVDP